ncbi:MAG: hypothetical protein PF517_22290 [Salinivirgaceae bacterium]|jgi:uncharacterized membrane protein YraQ (UPF0718 family)|nr:hypothetical protein [Salinivirgaceae bacterium]
MKIEYKQLDIKPQGSWIKRTFLSAHAKKTAMYMAIGAVGGLIFFYITEGRQMATIGSKDILNSMFFGTFLGFFLTNSPCARGRC